MSAKKPLYSLQELQVIMNNLHSKKDLLCFLSAFETIKEGEVTPTATKLVINRSLQLDRQFRFEDNFKKRRGR